MNNIKKINLLGMERNAMYEFVAHIGESNYRAEQIMKWIYQNNCDNFDLMTNINKKLRNKLKLIAHIDAPTVFKEYHSYDGTIKWNMLVGKEIIETVYIPEKHRATLCISSQVGCALNCSFCATGQQGFSRNLNVYEIIGQIWRAKKIIHGIKLHNYYPITNIVLMGMGEPLLNLNNVVKAIKIMLDTCGFAFSKRKITLSTVGIIPALNKLCNMVDIVLALSLHASTDAIRNTIMPINKKYNINSLMQSVKNYISNTYASQGRVTIEYVMLHNINDSVNDALSLIKCLRGIPCKINLIPWNSIPNTSYDCSSNIHIALFAKILKQHGFLTTIRKIRGYDINAACGQLTGHIVNRLINHNKKNISI
uniref:Dual-specificity RNA methyltransferase RlmN n=1 Tax=Candidatus Aschnera chinzeii TaxID=1485666 RepID=A0AAT9G549_9ENTR|nr:MAG: bifunctional tRNA (adenosine(37)-C2)-methyltransferase TrmG/ribosomal RNA large subunit methyltransferase RlmN [Candidatus Aschnera chinzeii]